MNGRPPFARTLGLWRIERVMGMRFHIPRKRVRTLADWRAERFFFRARRIAERMRAEA